MRLKSYYTGTVEAAMVLAREELGPEAMLVHSKRTTAETRHMGQYEIVFAVQDSEPPPAPPVPPITARRETGIDQLTIELEQLRQRIESMSGVMAGTAPAASPSREIRRPNPLIRSLLDAEIYPDLAETIVRSADMGRGGSSGLRPAIESLVRVDATLGIPNAPRRIVALAGPPGAGKTATLVKLAARHGLAARRSVHIFSADVYRPGAAEQLRLYASILGVGFQTIDTPLALAQGLEEQRGKDLIFIDTPGWPSRDAAEFEELARVIAGDPEIDVHLVLPASHRACELARVVDRYAVFRPGKLLFTRIDESLRFGPLMNESYRTGKPVSFLSSGREIPEDLEPATAARIANLIVGPPARSARSAVSDLEWK